MLWCLSRKTTTACALRRSTPVLPYRLSFSPNRAANSSICPVRFSPAQHRGAPFGLRFTLSVSYEGRLDAAFPTASPPSHAPNPNTSSHPSALRSVDSKIESHSRHPFLYFPYLLYLLYLILKSPASSTTPQLLPLSPRPSQSHPAMAAQIPRSSTSA